MVTRQIELDEDASKILDSLATEYGGNAGEVISVLLRTHQATESSLDELEAIYRDQLAAQEGALGARFSGRPVYDVGRS